MDCESELKKETGKWTRKIGKEIKKVRLLDPNKKDLLENIHAYVKDSKHFLEKGDPVRSFEAIVWAWAWLQILKELGVLAGEESYFGQ